MPRIVAFATDAIPLDVTAGVPFTLTHGLGRQVRGYLVVWSSAPVQCSVTDPAADTRKTLTLTPTASCALRLVLL